MSAKLMSFFFLFLFAWLHIQVLNYILYFVQLLTFSKCQFLFKYTLLDKYQSQGQSQIQIFHFFALFQEVATKIKTHYKSKKK